MPGGPGLTGHDIRAGIEDADDIMKDVQTDMRKMAQDVRWKSIQGDDRSEFFKGLTQEEWDSLYQVGTALGPKGENKLEQILKEILGMNGGNSDG